MENLGSAIEEHPCRRVECRVRQGSQEAGEAGISMGGRPREIFIKEFLDSFPGIAKGPPVHRGVAQPGRAPRLGRGCRQFESGRPDHFFSRKLCQFRCTWPSLIEGF